MRGFTFQGPGKAELTELPLAPSDRRYVEFLLAREASGHAE